MSTDRAPARRPPWRIPSLQALLVQLAAFGLVLAISFVSARAAGLDFSIAHAVLLQAVVAALLSRLAGMARWWTWIHLLFPPAAAAMHALRLPPLLFLIAFAALLVLYWSSFRTQVPYYPSRRSAWEAVLGLLPPPRAGTSPVVIDIGSGFGGMSLHIAAARPDARVEGIELAPLPWFVSVLRARLAGSHACFSRGDYERLDLGRYDLVFAYLSPAAMPALWVKACREMRTGSLLVSHEFPIPGQQPWQVLPTGQGRPPLFVWRMVQGSSFPPART